MSPGWILTQSPLGWFATTFQGRQSWGWSPSWLICNHFPPADRLLHFISTSCRLQFWQGLCAVDYCVDYCVNYCSEWLQWLIVWTCAVDLLSCYPAPTQSVCLVGGCVDTASEDYMGESGCVQNIFHLQHLSGKKEKQHLDLKLGWVGGWGSVIWDWTFLWREIVQEPLVIQRGGQIPRTDTIFSTFEICNIKMCNVALFLKHCTVWWWKTNLIILISK